MIDIIHAILDRTPFILCFLIVLIVLLSYAVFRKDINLNKRKWKFAYLYALVAFALLLIISVTPIYLLWENVNYINMLTEKYIEAELIKLSNDSITLDITRTYDYKIVGGSSTTLQYYVTAGGNGKAYKFLVWINTPFPFDIFGVKNKHFQIESIELLDSLKIYEKETMK